MQSFKNDQHAKMPEEVLWERFSKPVEYSKAIKLMEHYVAGVKEGSIEQRVMLLEHHKVYTSPRKQEAEPISGVKLKQTNRGGDITHHGPGQRVIYPILDLKRYRMDLHWYVSSLENWVVAALRRLNIPALTKELSRGVWLEHNSQIAKIGFIGVRVQSWITSHGCAVNISNSIKYFSHIKPCGIENCKVTSCKKAGYNTSLEEFDLSLINSFNNFF